MEYSQYINRVELQGIVGTSKVIFIGDKKAVRFSLATNYAYKDKEGYPVIETPGTPARPGRRKKTTLRSTGRAPLCISKEGYATYATPMRAGAREPHWRWWQQRLRGSSYDPCKENSMGGPGSPGEGNHNPCSAGIDHEYRGPCLRLRNQY